jgi:lysozyme
VQRTALIAIAAAAVVAAWLLTRNTDTIDDSTVDDDAPDQSPDWQDEIAATMFRARSTLIGSPVASLMPSQALIAHLHEFEQLRLTRYRLGDGGWTIGWGRYFPDGGEEPPERITRETADQWFSVDVDERGARWVRAYVTRPLQQHEFDALVSMAYNLTPKSFRTIAEAVNHFEDPAAAALRFVRAGTNLERGLRRRRAAELAMFNGNDGRYLA